MAWLNIKDDIRDLLQTSGGVEETVDPGVREALFPGEIIDPKTGEGLFPGEIADPKTGEGLFPGEIVSARAKRILKKYLRGFAPGEPGALRGLQAPAEGAASDRPKKTKRSSRFAPVSTEEKTVQSIEIREYFEGSASEGATAPLAIRGSC